MTLTIDLSREEESQLVAAATVEGVPPADLARRLLTEHLPRKTSDSPEQDPTLALFAQWDREDAAMTSEQVAEARGEFEEFKQNINAERRRAGARIIYP